MEVLMPFVVLVVGLCFGSFITMASWRLPREQDLVVKPSYCPNCDTKLGFRDLWPVLSWAIHKTRCRHCAKPISPRYPMTEIVTAGIFLLIYSQLGITPPGIILMLFAVALMVMIVVDIEHYIIPDSIHVVLLPLGLLYHLVNSTPWEEVAGGFAMGAGIGLLLHHGYRVIRGKEGLGFGDVKFLAVAGLWLGYAPIVPFLFLSGVLGVVTGLIWRALGKGPIFPFGPSLAISLFLNILIPQISYLFWHLGRLSQ
jgi:leader peptidase (prepilin peptidase)/N-methyltransferase